MEEDVLRAARAVTEALGPPVVVVNNAGIAGRRVSIEQTSPAEWDAVMAANLRGAFSR